MFDSFKQPIMQTLKMFDSLAAVMHTLKMFGFLKGLTWWNNINIMSWCNEREAYKTFHRRKMEIHLRASVKVFYSWNIEM